MKNLKYIIITLLICHTISVNHVKAQDCELPITVYVGEQEEISENAKSVLENALIRIAVKSGMNTDLRYTNIILTAHIDVLDKDIIPGPPTQIIRNLGITLYLADVSTQTKFSSAYIEVKGVGTNDTKCVIDALRRLTANNEKIKQMINSGQKKMFAYYNENYNSILKEAKRKASLQQYAEAIALTVAIPTCSQGGNEAIHTGLEIYSQYRDKENLILLNKARAVWNSGQNKQSAHEAGYLLSQIDPDATCYNDAVVFTSEIKKQIRDNLDFEMQKKYENQIELEKSKIDAIKAIGVAYGKGQQPITTNLTWLK